MFDPVCFDDVSVLPIVTVTATSTFLGETTFCPEIEGGPQYVFDGDAGCGGGAAPISQNCHHGSCVSSPFPMLSRPLPSSPVSKTPSLDLRRHGPPPAARVLSPLSTRAAVRSVLSHRCRFHSSASLFSSSFLPSHHLGHHSL